VLRASVQSDLGVNRHAADRNTITLSNLVQDDIGTPDQGSGQRFEWRRRRKPRLFGDR
jgi:hypothetical protein